MNNLAEISFDNNEEERIAEKMEQFGDILRGVSYKYLHNKWMSREDLEQELWVNLLNLLEDYGGALNVSPNLVAKSSFNSAVDYYRYCRRRYEANIIFEEENDENNASAFGSKFKTGYDIVRMKEVYQNYPLGSRERNYILIKLFMAGTLDIKYVTEPEDIEVYHNLPEKNIDSHIVYKLGYNSPSPGSFTAMKRRLRDEIGELLQEHIHEDED